MTYLQLRHISKSFPGTQALRQVSLEAYPGEVHVLLGQNGAGKSTLLSILSGGCIPEHGSMEIGGRPVAFGSPQETRKAGVAVVHQEMQLCESLTVAENIALGSEETSFGLLNSNKNNENILRAAQQINLTMPLETSVASLSLAQKQLVEIAKALYQKASVLLLDEPTAALSDVEVQSLFKVIRQVCTQGVCVIYISHRLDEVMFIGHRFTVLRNGEHIATHRKEEVTRAQLICEMIGLETNEDIPKQNKSLGKVRLHVSGLTLKDRITPTTLDIREGEILGLGGLMGSGQTQVLRLIFGADRATSGNITVNGTLLTEHNPHHAIASGMGFLTDDRKELGLLLNQTIDPNITLASLSQYIREGLLEKKREHRAVQHFLNLLHIKTSDPHAEVNTLSGGNQQKVIFARMLSSQCTVFLMDEPTRGIDIKGRHEIYRLMGEIAAQGASILFASSDIQELIALSDRIGIMHQGHLCAILEAQEATAQKVTEIALNGY